jgi:hypothetical protein
MTLADLLVESNDIRGRSARVSHTYEYYTKSLEKYIPWMKEQIGKSKEGFIRIKRGDLARAMKRELEIVMGDRYRDKTFNSLYDIIRIVLFNEGIFIELGNYNREKIFVARNRTPNDCLIPSLAMLEKDIKKMNN